MIKLITITVSTFIVLIGALGFAFAVELGFDVYDSLKFLMVAIAVTYALGYKLIYKEWKLKKSFIGFYVVPITTALAVHFIS